MGRILYRKIEKGKLLKLTPENQKKSKRGILIGDIFIDLTSEINKIKKEQLEEIKSNLKKELIGVSEKVIDSSTNQVTHIIISLKDIQKLNFKRRERCQKTKKKKKTI